MVDVTDSKSVGGDTVWVRVPPPAFFNAFILYCPIQKPAEEIQRVFFYQETICLLKITLQQGLLPLQELPLLRFLLPRQHPQKELPAQAERGWREKSSGFRYRWL